MTTSKKKKRWNLKVCRDDNFVSILRWYSAATTDVAVFGKCPSTLIADLSFLFLIRSILCRWNFFASSPSISRRTHQKIQKLPEGAATSLSLPLLPQTL